MSRKIFTYSAMLALMLSAAALSGCGSDNRGSDTGGVAKVGEGTCRVCHVATLDPKTGANIVEQFIPSAHNSEHAGCQGCHGGGANHNGAGPIPFPDPLAADRCISCHIPKYTGGNDLTDLFTLAKTQGFASQCARCHTDPVANPRGDVHGAKATGKKCIECHAAVITGPRHGAGTADNNGVRAVVGEFSKWSHHVTGVNLQDAHCAACHLEGMAEGGAIVVNPAYHMANGNTHLRNADTDADMEWNPDAPNHTTMDNYCMSCHDANGATSPQSAAIRAIMIPAAGKTASASNPFGDTISNRYDKMQRPAVVDASSQFNTSNNSHHAVKGPRYTGRTRAAGSRQIASPATFAQNSSALLQGTRSTIFDAGNFNQLYTPLENAGGEAAPRTGAATLGDDSTLHCGDCHTVGQWKAGVATNAAGQLNTVAIGAHGSNNEYLLRNSIGTDQRHTQNAFTTDSNNVVTYTNPNGAFLVCYNCHSYNKYGSIYIGTGLGSNTPGSIGQPHAGEYDSAGRCNGIGNTIPFNGYTTGTATDGTQFVSRFLGPISKYSSPATYAGEQNPDFGNIFGIQCANCHNSGIGNAFGGIHGSANNQNTTTQTADASVKGGAYVDGMGNTVKIQRFLPGLGNAMHVPGTLGGITGGSVVPVNTATGPAYTYVTGGVSNDTNWEQKAWNQTTGTVFNAANHSVAPTASAGAGCYTLGGATAATSALRGPSVTGAGGAATELLDTWGACEDHDAARGKGDHGPVKAIVRPVTY
ncbi:C-type polyheme cytochrome OmcC [Geobacter sp. OR-1]|uniref:hypothetical protein n=1 Tax=Geobacter sp. OR-1 TaxID=1266765 RepID=UPI000542B976|nr:hypothetical protein [Geobacter sp. OR-1]GAM08045.1 C-type polyheme cytochrome OmcC [Geobacter sp. OR-1]